MISCVIMVNPGAFQGARKAFLMGEKEAYSQAVDDGYIAEAVGKIQRRFFKRFPVELADDFEPTAEDLAKVDNDEIDMDHAEPDREKLSEREYEAAVKALEERQKRVAFKKGVSILIPKFWRSGFGMLVVYLGSL